MITFHDITSCIFWSYASQNTFILTVIILRLNGKAAFSAPTKTFRPDTWAESFLLGPGNESACPVGFRDESIAFGPSLIQSELSGGGSPDDVTSFDELRDEQIAFLATCISTTIKIHPPSHKPIGIRSCGSQTKKAIRNSRAHKMNMISIIR